MIQCNLLLIRIKPFQCHLLLIRVQPTVNPNRAFPVQPTANPNRAFPEQPTANPNRAFQVQSKSIMTGYINLVPLTGDRLNIHFVKVKAHFGCLNGYMVLIASYQ